MKTKKIVNIVNFIRAEDWRFDSKELHETFLSELELCKKYSMPYTFLMLYDAMIKPEYSEPLLKNADPNMEIGLWLELSKEAVERAGLEWKEERNWTWHVNPGMLLGYEVEDRKKIIDELMNRFQSIFGCYPESVGSWIIDTFSINYMKEKYHIKSVCICKEQYGTDGYTLWGGYYNQGYYPSKKNMFIPAQTKSEQVQVPIFRMLGPDPIYQYDAGLDSEYNRGNIQHEVLTMEPTYGNCGANKSWVEWYLKSNFGEEALTFAYTQVGQENSFLWKNFGEGLKMQMELISAGVKEGKWEALTLKDTGKWFSQRYDATPPTAVTALTDWKKKNNQSVWYSCKNYRLNFHNAGGTVGLRDLFFYNEEYPDRYANTPAPGDDATFDALPVVDGYCWGGNGIRSILRFVKKETGKTALGKIHSVSAEGENTLKIQFELDGIKALCTCREDFIEFEFFESCFEMLFQYNNLRNTKIKEIANNRVVYEHEAFSYGIEVTGNVTGEENGFRILPKGKTVALKPFGFKKN